MINDTNILWLFGCFSVILRYKKVSRYDRSRTYHTFILEVWALSLGVDEFNFRVEDCLCLTNLHICRKLLALANIYTSFIEAV